MNKIFQLSVLNFFVFVIFSCDKNQDPELPDLTAPELTYFQINGVEVNDDTIHLSKDEEFTLRFDFTDNVSVLEGELSLIINNLEGLSKTIDKGPGQSNYKFTYGLQNLKAFSNLKGTSNYIVQPNDQIKFNLHAIDPSNNLTERSITVIVF